MSVNLPSSAEIADLERLEGMVNKLLAEARIDLMCAAYRATMSNANGSKRLAALHALWSKRCVTLVIDLLSLSSQAEPTEPNGSSLCEPKTSST